MTSVNTVPEAKDVARDLQALEANNDRAFDALYERINSERSSTRNTPEEIKAREARAAARAERDAPFIALGLELRKKFIQCARAIRQGQERGSRMFKWDGHHAKINWGPEKRNGTDGFQDCTAVFVTLINVKFIHEATRKAAHPILKDQSVSRLNVVIDNTPNKDESRIWVSYTDEMWLEIAELEF